MTSSLRVHLFYWTVLAACYSTSLFLMWHFLRGNPSPDVRFAIMMISSVGFAFSQIVATLVCRSLGYSLARRVETRIEAQPEASLQDEVEVRSYSSHKTFKMLTWMGLGGAGIVVLMAPFLWSHGKAAIEGFYFIFSFFLALAGFCGLMAWMGRGGRFLAKADATGLEISAGSGGRRHFGWAEIGSVVRIENFDLFGASASTSLEFRNARGKVRTTVLFYFVPSEQQQQFSQVVSRYLKSSTEA